MMNVFNLLTSAITYQSIIQFNMTSKFPLEAFSRRTLEVRVLGFPRRRQYKPSWVWLTTICCSLDVHGCRLWHQSKLNLLPSQTDIFIPFPISLSLSMKLNFLMDPNWTLAPPKVIVSDIHR